MAPTSFQTYDVPPPGFDLRALTSDVSDNAYGIRPVAAIFIRSELRSASGGQTITCYSIPTAARHVLRSGVPGGALDPRWTVQERR